jgi:hypothetical protein
VPRSYTPYPRHLVPQSTKSIPIAQPFVPQNIVLVVRVSPIDGDIAGIEVIGELNQRIHRRFPAGSISQITRGG